MSLRDFGEKSRLHPFHVLAIEQGQLAANTKTLRAIAATLEVSPADLLNYDTENDLGFLSELMRKEPDMVKKIRERIEFLVVN